MADCVFNTVRERDMDLLFAEAFLTDAGFLVYILKSIGLPEMACSTTKVDLSKTDSDGESDITVLADYGGQKIGLLIEDKIDAPAMEHQALRYKKRGESGIRSGEYDFNYVVIFCPQKYYDANSEAKKYPYFISYESILSYFCHSSKSVDLFRQSQIRQAIEKAKKPPETILNEKANAFFIRYKQYVRLYYPSLDLRTSGKSNGWWPRFGTVYGRSFIYHKPAYTPDYGIVDYTFPNGAGNIAYLQEMAAWLRSYGGEAIRAEVTGKSAALRIEVPVIDFTSVFEEVDEEKLRKCLDAVLLFSDFARVIQYGQLMTEQK